MKNQRRNGKSGGGPRQKAGTKKAEATTVRESTADDFGPDVIRPRWWPAPLVEEGSRAASSIRREGPTLAP